VAGPFSSSRAKLARAEEHRKVLEREIQAFSESDPVRLRSKHNLESTQEAIQFSYYVAEIIKPPPHWSLVAGDSIQNLRAALEHAIWAIVIKEKGEPFAEANARRIDFPIVDAASRFPEAHLVKIGLPPYARSVIEQAQPYARHKDTPRDDPLWLIRALSNVDKHRLLHVVAMIPEHAEVLTQPALPGLDLTWETKGALHKGAKVVSFVAPRPKVYTKVQVQLNCAIGVCITATPETKPVGIDVALRAMHERVAEIIDGLTTAVRAPRRHK
jgi:hypothetical protein